MTNSDEHALLIEMRRVLVDSSYIGEYGTCQVCNADMSFGVENTLHEPDCPIGNILKATEYLLEEPGCPVTIS